MRRILARYFRFKQPVGHDHPRQDHADTATPTDADLFDPSEKSLVKFRKAIHDLLKKYAQEVRSTRRDIQSLFNKLSSEVSARLESHKIELQGTHNSSVKQLMAAKDSIDAINGQVTALRQYVADQQGELRRYQDGFNWVITKDFCNRIIGCIDDMAKMSVKEGISDAHKEDLSAAMQQLVYALDGCGVQQFSPPVDADHREHRSYAEIVATEPASDPEQAGTIARIVAPGYTLYISDNQSRIIRPAKVVVRDMVKKEKANE